MAFDGAFLRCIKEEMEALLRDARVDKIHQPSREELLLTLRQRSGSYKLYISSRAASPRIHFTDVTLENPASPPMFCMLLRKRITGGGWWASGSRDSSGRSILTSIVSMNWATSCG